MRRRLLIAAAATVLLGSLYQFWFRDSALVAVSEVEVSGLTTKDAPRIEADVVTQEAYSSEVISFGFWAGDDNLGDAAFYSYTAPEPAGPSVVMERTDSRAGHRPHPCFAPVVDRVGLGEHGATPIADRPSVSTALSSRRRPAASSVVRAFRNSSNAPKPSRNPTKVSAKPV